MAFAASVVRDRSELWAERNVAAVDDENDFGGGEESLAMEWKMLSKTDLE